MKRFFLLSGFAIALIAALSTNAVAGKTKFQTTYWTASTSPITDCAQITDCDEVSGSTCTTLNTYKSNVNIPCQTPVALFRHP